MSVLDYTDRFIANLLAGGTLTCCTMAIVEYFDWLDDGVAGLPPEVAKVCLVMGLAVVVLFLLPWLRRFLVHSRHTLLVDDGKAFAGVWRGRAMGAIFGLFAAVSIILQLR